eukprot:s3561_g17.t1
MAKGGKKGAFWVESLTSSPLAFVGMVNLIEDTVHDTAGYGVLDLGATETVGSLEALEALMALRSQIHGVQEPVEVYPEANAVETIRYLRRNLLSGACVALKRPDRPMADEKMKEAKALLVNMVQELYEQNGFPQKSRVGPGSFFDRELPGMSCTNTWRLHTFEARDFFDPAGRLAL